MSAAPVSFTVERRGRFLTNPKAAVRDIAASMESGMRRASIIMHRHVKAGLSARMARHPFWGAVGGVGGLAVRTGRTRARLSPAGRIYRQGSRIIAAVGSPDEHVRELEEGGTFTTSGWFRIPTIHAQTPAGVDRHAGLSIRDIPGTFIRGLKGGRLLAFQRTADKRVVPLYLLTKSVRRRGRHVFAKAKEKSEPEVVRALGRDVSLAVNRANT